MSKSRTVYHQHLRQISNLLRQTPPTAPEDMKTCHQCGQQYPREIQYWCKRYNRDKVYLCSPCVNCRKAYYRTYHQQHYQPHPRSRTPVDLQQRAQANRERNRQIVEEFRKTLK